MKWFSAFLSALIVGAFVGFYFWTYTGQKAYLNERDARLLASAARSLREAVQADEPDSRVLRRGATLVVSGLALRSPEEAARKAGPPEYKVELGEVLERVARPEVFAALLVTDKSGAVLAQHPRARIEGLRHLAGDPVDAKQAEVQAAEAQALTRRPTLRRLSFGERTLLAFCHPATLPAPPDSPAAVAKSGSSAVEPPDPLAVPEGETLVLCGLADEVRLEREAGSVSPLALAGLLAVFALTLLVPPFLKIPLLTRPQRLRFADVFALAACQFLGLMIAATAIFGVAGYYGLGARADDELRAIAAEVRKHLGVELKQIERQMQRNDATLLRVQANALAHGSELRVARVSLLARDLCSQAAVGAAQAAPGAKRAKLAPPACGGWTENLPDYPFFETLAWIGPDGRQRVKWWTRGESASTRAYFDVSRRSYFSDVRDDRLVHASRESGWPDGFVLTSVRAWSNGEVRAVVSRPGAALQTPTTKAAGLAAAPAASTVQALTTRLITLDDPVLPAGTGFVLVDGRGDVLFHSDARLSRSHNLFEETASNPRLRAALLGRRADTLVAHYWGSAHSLHVEPLQPLPWSLVVFREHDWLRAVAVEALAEALLLCLAFTLGVFLLPALAYIALCGRRTPFPWPNRDLTWLYTHAAGTFVFIGALFLGGLARCHGEDALALALTLPVAAVLSAGVVLAGRSLLHRRWPQGVSVRFARPLRLLTSAGAGLLLAGVSWFARTPVGLLVGAGASALLALALIEGSERVARSGGFRWPHRVASTAFWLLFAVLPAVGFVKGATERALEASAARSLTLFAQRLEARARAVQAAYPDSLHAADALRARRLEPRLDVFTGALHRLAFEPQQVCATAPATSARSRAAWLGDWLARLKPFLADHAVDLRYSRAPRDDAGQPLWRWSACTTTTPPSIVSAQPPGLAEIAGVWPWLALVLLAVAIGAMVVWAERALFATEVSPCASRPIGVVKTGTLPGARLLLLTPSGFEQRELLDGDWYERWPAAQGAAVCDKPWLVTEAELTAGDAAQRSARLDAFEVALRDVGRALVVVAARPPSAWSADLPPRWSALLERFEVLVAISQGGAAGLEERVAAWLGPHAPPRLHELVRAEMRASPHVFALCRARLQPGDLAGCGRRAIVRRIEQAAESYYRSAWETCSADERLTLVQVAEEGFVNPRRVDVLEGLLAKGLARLKPALEPMNASFEAFVSRHEQTAPLQTAEAARGTGFNWTQLRTPLFTLGAVVAVFIFVTERQTFDSAAGLSTLVVGSVVPLLGQIAKAVRNLAAADAAGGGGGGGAAA